MATETVLRHLTRGGELLRADRVDEARVELEAARELEPADGRVLNLLGLVYFRLGNFPDAKHIYRQLVQRQDKDAALRLNLGLVHMKLGEVEAAIEQLSKARELDPSQSRTIGYLGLAYARAGQYAKAREAFLQAGQEELAREMEQYLTDDKAAAKPAGTPAEPAKAAEQHKPPAQPALIVEEDPDEPDADAPELEEADEDDDGDGEAENVPRSFDPHATPTAKMSTLEAASRAAASKAGDARAAGSDGVPTPSGEGIVTAAVRIAAPTASMADYATGAGGGSAPIPVSQFATARLLRPDDGELPLELGADGTLIVRVRGRVLSRTQGVIVSGGELAYEPATKRMRGKMSETPFGSEERPMFWVTGTGHLCAAPLGGTFTALELADDALYVREELVFAFEERLRWENGHVPGGGRALGIVQFRGEGCVALRTPATPLTVKLAPEKVLYVDADRLAGWIGRVVPRVVSPAAGGDASAPFVECSGEGVIIVLPPASPDELGVESGVGEGDGDGDEVGAEAAAGPERDGGGAPAPAPPAGLG